MNKKTLLLHSCCGPCSSYVLSYLKEDFDITLVYYNPNIYPRREYYKRYNEQKRLIKEMFNDEIKIMNCPYIPLVYYSKVYKNKKDKEGGSRCHICYKLRMEKLQNLLKSMALITLQLHYLFHLIKILIKFFNKVKLLLKNTMYNFWNTTLKNKMVLKNLGKLLVSWNFR